MSTPRENKQRDTLNIRITPELRSLIDRAADVTGKNRADFVLDATHRAAEERFWTARCFTSVQGSMLSLFLG